METSLRLSFPLGAAIALTAVAAHATPMTGSFPAAVTVTTPGTLINVGSTLTLASGATTGAGTTSFSGTTFGSNAITGVTSPITLTNGQSFDFTIAGFGTFVGTSVNVQLNPISTMTNRSVAFNALGTFTPIGPFTADSASITGSFTQTGGASSAVSFSFTFNSPAVAVAEPAGVAVFGLGVVGLGVVLRRRAK